MQQYSEFLIVSVQKTELTENKASYGTAVCLSWVLSCGEVGLLECQLLAGC